MRSIEERIEGPAAESWVPENEGDKVVGVIEEVGTREGDYGPFKVLSLFNEDTNTAWSVAGFGAVLGRKFDHLTDADVGRKVAIIFKGQRQPKKQGAKPYKDYDMVLGPAPVAAAAASAPAEFNDERF